MVREPLEKSDVFKVAEEAGFSYDATQDIFYSMRNPWQREYGYCRLYDEACAPMSLIVDSEPVRFEYAGKKWLIEFWKGQYGMTTGGEIGVYHTTGPDLDIPGLFYGTYYDSVPDEEQLEMSFVLKKNGKDLYTRTDRHWWLTGFVLGEFSEPEEISMDLQIKMKDQAMLAAFLEGLKKHGYTEKDYETAGETFRMTFEKPRSTQPKTRMRVTDKIAQNRNRFFCENYQNLTSSLQTTKEKLERLREKNPVLFRKLIAIGKPRTMFMKFDNIRTQHRSENP